MLNLRVRFPPDPGLVAVLAAFGVAPGDLLGHGGEAWVYALDDARVIRVLHEGATADRIVAGADLAARLGEGRPPFQLPELIDVGQVGGRWYAVERRLRGRSVLEELARVDDRRALVEAYLACADQLGDLPLPEEDWWGDILAPPPVRSESWHGYLSRKAAESLRTAGPDFAAVDADAIAGDLPAPSSRSFVHLDAFPGNVLAEGREITAVIDLAATAVAGDRRLDPLASAVYLAPEITPTADDGDRDVAGAWLRNAGLANLFEPAQRWLAAYWSFAVDDHALRAWCRSVLLRRLRAGCVRMTDDGRMTLQCEQW